MTGALNTRPTVVLRLLTWQSPSLPLGAWIAAAAAGGGALSAAGTALALLDSSPGQRRRIRREPEREEPWEGSASTPRGQAWSGERPGAAQPGAGHEHRSRAGRSASKENVWEREQDQAWRQPVSAGPDRAPGEPPPTLSVPYRVIRRGRSESPSEPLASAAPWSERQPSDRGGRAPQAEAGRRAEPVAAADDWGSNALEDW